MNARKWHSVAGGVIIAVGFLLYFYTLGFPYVFDDYIYLVGNPLFKDANSFAFPFHFKCVVTMPVRMGLDPDLSANFILRPVTYLTFYINYALDGMNPRGYRGFNIAIHCANALLVFQVLVHLLRESKKGASLSASSVGFIAFCSSILFLVHPLQTESVTYVVQRFTSLGTLFYLLTVLTYFRSISSTNNRKAWVLRWSSMVFVVAGMLSKEEVFTAPFILVVIDCLVMGTPFKAASKRAFPYFLTLFVIPVLMILISCARSDGDIGLSSALNIANSVEKPVTQVHYLLTQFSVVLSYLRLIVLPFDLNLDRDYPLSNSLFQTSVLVSLLLIIAILAGTWAAWRRRKDEARWSLLFCSVLWFFLTVAPSSSIAPLPDLMADHRSYLPSIGALVALVCCADLLRTRLLVDRDVRVAIPLLMAIWILLLSSATIIRNCQWRSNIALWEDTVSKSRNKWRPWSNLASAYYDNNEFRKSVSCLANAVHLEPNYIRGYIDLGKACKTAGMPWEGIAYSRDGLARKPGNSDLLFNLAVCQWDVGQHEMAVETFRQASRNRPNFKAAHQALGLALEILGDCEGALIELKIAGSIPPGDPATQLKIAELEDALSRQRAAAK